MSNFTYGKSAEEKKELFEEIKELLKDGYTLREVGNKYGVSKQRVQQFLLQNNYSWRRIKNEVKEEINRKIKTIKDEEHLEYIEQLRKEKVELQASISYFKRKIKILENRIEEDARVKNLQDRLRNLLEKYIKVRDQKNYYRRMLKKKEILFHDNQID